MNYKQQLLGILKLDGDNKDKATAIQALTEEQVNHLVDDFKKEVKLQGVLTIYELLDQLKVFIQTRLREGESGITKL